ncbi:GHKL domain-containing protein [Stappia sp. GBMRC 2046]|uniref:histidine kinase n=1 Tax=Stappia sediminis TaxID=2692190 RepID=A0A7X3LR86_9HYPH|nr:HAMP domain-containing sensor histidine kinase [Stappia sediminis]MXN63624.1 GHKL domain-containing protein [Stappia sediminis]
MTRGSLRLRLLVAGAASILIALGVSVLGLMFLFERHVERRVEAELGVFLDQIVSALDKTPEGTLVLSRDPADPRFRVPLSGLYWQVDTGDGLIRSRSLWDTQLQLPADELSNAGVHRHRIDGPAGQRLITLERSVLLPTPLGGGKIRAAVALDAADVTAATMAFAADLLPYLAVFALVLIVAAYVQVSVGLRPLAAIRRRLAAIGEGRTSRVGTGFPDEILPLARELDGLLEAREMQVERARARAADLAHGLKTPLQVLIGDVNRLRTKGETVIADEIDQVVDTMQRHVEKELVRARVAAGALDATADVASVIERVLSVVGRTPEGAKLNWSLDMADKAVARVDPDDLAEALGNLLENAARHARSRVVTTVRLQGQMLSIRIVDDGPGIPEDRLAEMTQRGARLDSAGDGAGLGLAIVQDIAEAWGGNLQISNAGPGFEATLALERASSHSPA